MYLPPYELTKIDVAALRKCDRLVIRTDAADLACIAIKEKRVTDSDPFADEIRYRIPAPVLIAPTWRVDISQARGFDVLYHYQTQVTLVTSIIATLRVGDAIRFEFHADYHSTPYLEERGLAHDALLLSVSRGDKQVALFELATQVSEVNSSARMVRGAKRRESVA